MDAIGLSHVQLSKVEPGSLLLIGPTDSDAEQYFAIAVHRAGEQFAARWLSFRADRGALRGSDRVVSGIGGGRDALESLRP